MASPAPWIHHHHRPISSPKYLNNNSASCSTSCSSSPSPCRSCSSSSSSSSSSPSKIRRPLLNSGFVHFSGITKVLKHQSLRAHAMDTTQGNATSPKRITKFDDEPDHLLVLVHGIMASPSDWTYVEAELKRRLGRNFLIYGTLKCSKDQDRIQRIKCPGKEPLKLRRQSIQVQHQGPRRLSNVQVSMRLYWFSF